MAIRTLDLFCGGGGSSWGASQAGAEIVMGVDGWERAVETYSHNFPGKGRKLIMTPETMPKDLGLRKGEIDLLLASPECTNHTCAKGARPRCEDSKRTANYVINFAKGLKPKWIVVENVVHMQKWDGFGDLLAGLREDAKYHCTVQTIDAASLGVPQTRRRMFIMCSREKAPGLIVPERLRERTVQDILQGEPGRWDAFPTSRFDAKDRAQPTKDRFNRAVDALGRGVPFLIVYYGSDAAGGWQEIDRPLRTITTLDRFGLVTWPDKKTPYFRMLQPLELMRAMGFEDSHGYTFTGTRRERIKQIGNGVCPPVMEAVVRHLVRQG